MPMNCSSGISNLRNFCLLHHAVGFSPGWSDSLSLHFHLDDLDIHCIFDLLVHMGPFLPGGVLSLRRHLEDFGLLHLHWCHGWLDTRSRNWFTGSLLDPVLRFSPTADCRYGVSSTCCVIFGTLTIISNTCGFLHVDDLLNDSSHVFVPFERSQPPLGCGEQLRRSASPCDSARALLLRSAQLPRFSPRFVPKPASRESL